MKQCVQTIILLIAFLSFNDASATHVMGSDISWKSLGNDQFEVFVNVYRDCNGVNLSNSKINFSGTCSNFTVGTQTMSQGVDITPVCPGVKSRCADRSSSYQYGLERYVLSTVVDVSQFKKSGCCELNVAWAQCCRNGAITTGAANQNFYVSAVINTCISVGPNGPKFRADPIAFLCLGRDAYLDFSVEGTDTNSNGGVLDSFNYSFVEPAQSANTAATWKAPYSKDKPLSYLGFPKDYPTNRFPFGFHLDPSIGVLAFRPMKLEVTVITVKIEQYRSGKKIGETRRDIQIYVTKCGNNTTPALQITRANSSLPIIGNKIRLCPGEKLCLDFKTTDKDSLDTTFLKAKFNIPGAKFSYTQNGAFAEGQFCWTPSANQASVNPYYLGVEVKDKGCPSPGVVNQGFMIEVGNPKVSVGKNISECAYGQKIRLKASPLGGTWSSNNIGVDNNGYFMLADKNNTGLKSYIYTLRDSFGCDGSDTLSVHIKPLPEISFSSDSLACADSGDTINLKVSPKYGSWTDQDVKGDSNRFYIVVDTSMVGNTKALVYEATNLDGCTSQETFNLNVLKEIAVFAGNHDTACVNTNGKKYLLNGSPQGGTWSGPSVNSNNGQSYTSLSSQMITSFPHEFIYSYADPNGCQGSDTVLLLVKEMPSASFTADVTSGPSPLKVSFTNTSSVSAAKYDWDFGDGKTSKQKSPKHTFSKDGNYTVSLTTYGMDSICDSTYTMLIQVGSTIGIDDAKDAGLIIYPNPSQGAFSIENTEQNTELKIYSPIGQLVRTVKLNNGKQNLDLTDLPKGIYLYKTSLNQSGTILIE